MGLIIKNGLWATLAADIDADDTTITLTTGHGERFGAIASPDYMYCTLIQAEAPFGTEHVKITNRSGDTLTVARAQDGSSALAFAANDRIECRPINAAIREFLPLSGGTMTGQLTLPPGGASALSLAFSDNPNTGIYEDDLDRVNFRVKGSSSVRLDQNQIYFDKPAIFVNGSVSAPTVSWVTGVGIGLFSELVPGAGGTVGIAANLQEIARFGSVGGSVVNGIKFSKPLEMSGSKITGLAAGTANGDAVRFEQLPDTSAFLTDEDLPDVSGLLPKDGSAAMTGALPMGGNKITGIGTPTSNGDAIRVEEYAAILAALDNVFTRTGDTMAGNINMDGHFIINLPAATGTGEAVTFEQLSTHAMLPPAVDDVVNLTLAFAADAGALTINVHTYNDETPSEENPCIVMMRDANTASGVIHERRITAALSLTIPSGATFGHAGGAAGYVHVYVIDNAGVLELAVSHNFFGASGMMTTTAISSGSNAPTVMYSAVARTNVPVRSIARIFFPSITGSWSTTNLWIDPGERSFPPPHVDIAMGGLKITGLGAATANGDAVRYEQVVGQYLPLAGGTLSGVLHSQNQIRISNGVALLWPDNASGFTFPGFLLYNNAHVLQLGASGSSRVNIASDGMGVNVPILAEGGIPAWPASPAIGINNNTIISWKDNTSGYSSAGCIWYDNANFLNLGAGGLSRIHIGSGGMGITVPVVLYSGHLIYPATQVPSADPNTLDDYEEGTFTPNLTFGDVQGAAAYLTQTGTYTKIGNRISFTIVVVVNGKSAATGPAKIAGLPFTAFEYTACAARITGCTGMTGTAFAVTTTGTSTLLLQGVTTTGGSVVLDDSHFITTPNFVIAGTYKVA